MALFGNKKKKNGEKTKDIEEPIEGIDPLANFQKEAAAPTDFKKSRRAAPTKEQKEYFAGLQNESGARPQIARILENSGFLNDEMISDAIQRGGEEAAQVKKILVEQGSLSAEDFDMVLAEGLGMERVDMNAIKVTEELIAQIDPKTAKEYKVFPVRFTEDRIEVAVADPMDIQVTDDLSRILNKHVIPLMGKEDEIERHIKKYYDADVFTDIYQQVTDDLHAEVDAKSMDDYMSMDVADEDESPAVVKFVDLIFKQAVHDRASDIHIEPTRYTVAIRFRIDGVCHEVPSPPKKWQNAIVSRLKVLSGMDLAEKRIPQDGRIKLNLPDRKLDLRVSLLPAIYGESIVMRILDQSSVLLGLEDVGFLPDNIQTFSELIRTPTGVILMTGPTGSGKTTTLYSALSTLNTPEKKIITIENPVEYMLDGIIQVQVDEHAGIDFSRGLRAMLRQSPDVILVGEIRDLETAEIAVRAALTGHLVFSTLHTNDAPSAASRLSDMGIKPFLVASSVQAVLAQRLLRRICPHCKREEWVDLKGTDGLGETEEELENGVNAMVPVGCDRCSSSGYRGRTAIHEIFIINSRLRQMIIAGESSSRLKRFAVKQGMRTLRMDGFRKVVLGQTTMEEVDRVTAAD